MGLISITCSVFTIKLPISDTSNTNLLYKITEKSGSVAQIKFSPDGKYMGSLFDNNIFFMWDSINGNEICSIKGGNVFGIKDFQFLLEENVVVLINIQNSEYVLDYYRVDNCHHIKAINPIIYWNISSLHISPDGTYIITTQGRTNEQHTIQIWHTENLTLAHSFPIESFAATSTISYDGTSIAIWDKNGKTYTWRIENGETISVIENDEVWEAGMFAPWVQFALSTNGKNLAYVKTGNRKDIFIYDLSTNEIISNIFYGGNVEELIFSPDDSMLATSTGSNIYIWDYAEIKILQIFRADNTVRVMSFSPDSKMVAIGLTDGKSNIEVFKAK